jgi:hypothetical protein
MLLNSFFAVPLFPVHTVTPACRPIQPRPDEGGEDYEQSYYALAWNYGSHRRSDDFL